MSRRSLLVVLGMCVWAHASAQAQEKTPPPPKPLLIVNVASVERSLNDIGAMFTVAGRPDMNEVIQDFLGDRAGDLKGIDRSRSFGLMGFLDDGFPPQPRFVIYLPVTNVSDLIRTMELGPGTIKKKSETDYEISRRRGSMYMRIVDDYALISLRDEAFLDRDLPNPQTVSAGLTSRYDVAVSLQIRNLSPTLREVFLGMFRQQALAELQQRDNEADSTYKARKASGMSTVQLIEQVLRDGEQVTFGVDSVDDGSRTVVELHVDALPESEFSRFLKNIAGAPTYFEPLLKDQTPFTLSVSWNMDPREKELGVGLVDSLRSLLLQTLPGEHAGAVETVASSLQATVEQGHFDMALQFLPRANKEFVLLGGWRIIGGEALGGALRELLQAVGERDDVASVELDAETHQGVTLHRIKASRVDNEEIRIYGSHPYVHVGTGNGVLWFALGAEGAIPALKDAIDVTLGTSPGQRLGSSAPFQVVFRMLPWMSLPPREGQNPQEREIAMEAMQDGDDALHIEFRPSETGGRLRLQFDKGFVRLVGLVFGQLFDRTQL